MKFRTETFETLYFGTAPVVHVLINGMALIKLWGKAGQDPSSDPCLAISWGRVSPGGHWGRGIRPRAIAATSSMQSMSPGGTYVPLLQRAGCSLMGHAIASGRGRRREGVLDGLRNTAAHEGRELGPSRLGESSTSMPSVIHFTGPPWRRKPQPSGVLPVAQHLHVQTASVEGRRKTGVAGPIKRLKERPPGHRKALAPKVGLNSVLHLPSRPSLDPQLRSSFPTPSVHQPRSPSPIFAVTAKKPSQYVPVSEQATTKTTTSVNPLETPQGYFRPLITPTIPLARSSPLITITALSQNSLFTRLSLATNTPHIKQNTVASQGLPQ